MPWHEACSLHVPLGRSRQVRRAPLSCGGAWNVSLASWTSNWLRATESGRYRDGRLYVDRRPNRVADFVTGLVSVNYTPKCPLGKTDVARFLRCMASPDAYQSVRRFPSFRETVANGVTTEPLPRRLPPKSSPSAERFHARKSDPKPLLHRSFLSVILILTGTSVLVPSILVP